MCRRYRRPVRSPGVNRWQDRAVDRRARSGCGMGGQRRHGPDRTTRGPAPRRAGRADRPGGPGGRGARTATAVAPRRRAGAARRAGGPERTLPRWGDQLWRRDRAWCPRATGGSAVSLARPDDVAALPAWLGRDVPADDPWPIVYEAAAAMSAAALDEQAALLGTALRRGRLGGALRAIRLRSARLTAVRIGTGHRVARSVGGRHGRRPVLAVGRAPLWRSCWPRRGRA